MAHNPHSINSAFDKSFRGVYIKRFLMRCLIVAITFILFFLHPDTLDVMIGWGFFKKFSPFHVLWAIWMFDMIMQLIPSTGYWPLGSQKYSNITYVPITKRINIRHLKQIIKDEKLTKYLNMQNILQHINRVHIAKYINKARLVAFIKESTRDAYYIAILWILMVIGLACLNRFGIIDYKILMLVAVCFYLSDVICVLFWCPFRVFFMKNRCCTTCRIFNWDHLMMFSPFLFIPGFYTWTLAGMSIIIFLVWEITFFVHPERFWEDTNDKLACRNCTDELCGRKLAITETAAQLKEKNSK